MRQRENKALRALRRIVDINKDVLVQGEDIQEINKELEKISEEEKDTYGLSTLFCTIFIRTFFYIELVLNN